MMRRFIFVGAIMTLISLALGDGGLSRAGVVYDKAVSPDGLTCTTPGVMPEYTTIADAIAAADDDDTVFVCAGNYPEGTVVIDVPGLTLLGPAAIPEGVGVATVSLQSPSTRVIEIGTSTTLVPGVTVSGFTLDATSLIDNTVGVQLVGQQLDVTVTKNVITNVTGNGVSMFGQPDGVYDIEENNITTGNFGITCMCSNSFIISNTIVGTHPDGRTAIDVSGQINNILSNTITGGGIRSTGDAATISNNDIDLNGTLFPGIEVYSGIAIVIKGNSLSDGSTNDYVLSVSDSGIATDVAVSQNTFDSVPLAIGLSGAALSATIGGAQLSNANVFTNSGGDEGALLGLSGVTNDIDARNNNWGLCTAEEIAFEIYDNADNPSLGTVDFVPFIDPGDCSSLTPTPSATPTGGATLTPQPSPSPTQSPTPTVTQTVAPTATATATLTPTATPTGDLTATATPTQGVELLWGDSDCDGEITARDNQALLREVLDQPALSQTEPCPDLSTSVDGRVWGDWDCNGEISARDNQALLRHVLSQNALSQTEPCPDIGEEIILLSN